METTPEGSLQELGLVLDEELQRLPERDRQPLLLCYLEGQTRDHAARQLGLSLRTLHRRLEGGLARLRKRLTGRGITLSAALARGRSDTAVGYGGYLGRADGRDDPCGPRVPGRDMRSVRAGDGIGGRSIEEDAPQQDESRDGAGAGG